MFKIINNLLASTAVGVMLAASASAATPVNFSQGFEVDDSGWNVFAGYTSTRVASGTNGVTSADGSFHSEAGLVPTAAGTRWGAYSDTFAPYITSLDIYLDVNAGIANDRRFDFTSAINNTAGSHRRDFAFNGGFYNSGDLGGPGGATNRFVFSGSNSTGRANSFPKNPARSPIAIDQTGWYTFTHDFHDNGLGILEVELSVSDSSANVLGTWTLSDLTDVIGVTVGGNRYGLLLNNELPLLAFDNSSLNVVPEPASFALAGLASISVIIVGRRLRRA